MQLTGLDILLFASFLAVVMAGSGFGASGLAVASYEWIATITLVLVAYLLLPLFLRSGIYTMPQFLEYRYSIWSRGIMAVSMLVMYVVVALPAILYSGAVTLRVMFDLNLTQAVWLIGLTAGAYTIYGGLKAVVWSDLLQGTALVMGGFWSCTWGSSRSADSAPSWRRTTLSCT